MIRGINAGPHLTISDGYAPVPNFSPGAQSAGMVRYNTNIQCMEVYDGQGWQSIYTAFPTVELAPASREGLEWAMRKQQEERDLKAMMQRHPGLRDLHDKFEMMKVLCYEEENKHV
jgi:hypothetical protein